MHTEWILIDWNPENIDSTVCCTVFWQFAHAVVLHISKTQIVSQKANFSQVGNQFPEESWGFVIAREVGMAQEHVNISASWLQTPAISLSFIRLTALVPVAPTSGNYELGINLFQHFLYSFL